MAVCKATPERHCCWIPGFNGCPHFDPDADVAVTGGYCKLMTELNDWDLVHADPRYAPQRKALEEHPGRLGIVLLCGDWPPPGVTCTACGVEG